MGALALNAPAAMADSPTHDCRLRSVQQDTVTGQTFQGVLAGVIVHGDNSPVSIRCSITVNGVEADTTPTGTGNAAATTQKLVSFAAGDTDVVRICVHWTSNHGSGSICITIGIIQVPPQVVYDTLDSVLDQVWPIVDPPICAILSQLAGTYGTPPAEIVINTEGDVYVGGDLWWDCPPYEPET